MFDVKKCQCRHWDGQTLWRVWLGVTDRHTVTTECTGCISILKEKNIIMLKCCSYITFQMWTTGSCRVYEASDWCHRSWGIMFSGCLVCALMSLSGEDDISYCHNVLRRISPNVQLCCIWEQRWNWLDFGIKRSKVKVTTRPNIVKKTLLGPFS